MADFTAKDVQRLRQMTGAGMMDAKNTLAEADGDFETAAKLLREKGLAKAVDRLDRENTQGAVAVATTAETAVVVELRCETDFVAKSPDFVRLTQELADAYASRGDPGLEALKDAVDDLKVALKENIEVGRTERVALAPHHVVDTYVHRQDGRGVNAVVVVLSGGSRELAHDIAVHVAFTKPSYLGRDEVPAELVEEERETLTKLSRAEGKPEAALPKIVEGRLAGWYKERVLLDQPFVRDEKQTVAQLVESAGAELIGFVQVFIGG